MNNSTDKMKRTFGVDDLIGMARLLPDGVDLDEAIRQASHDSADRRFLRWQVQYWQEEQKATGLDATIINPNDPKHASGETNLSELVRKLRQWYTEDELMRLLPQVLVLFEEQ